MIIVVSQAWTLDAEASAAGYIEQSRTFLAFMRHHAGFKQRKLIRGLDDPTHFTHLRWFDEVRSYETMISHPDHPKQIAALTQYIDTSKYKDHRGREYMHIVLDD